ncbi:hypothetical protein ACFLZZ_00515 [Nanoarchaeota archaeon]
MNLFKWVNKGVKKMSWYDISLTKMSVFFLTLFLLTVWPTFAKLAFSIHWGWYLGLGILVAIPVWRDMFA